MSTNNSFLNLIYKKLTKPRKILFFNIFLVSILTLMTLNSLPASALFRDLFCQSAQLNFDIPIRNSQGSSIIEEKNPLPWDAQVEAKGEIISPDDGEWKIKGSVNDRRVFSGENLRKGNKVSFTSPAKPGINKIKLTADWSKKHGDTNLKIVVNGKACPW